MRSRLFCTPAIYLLQLVVNYYDV